MENGRINGSRMSDENGRRDKKRRREKHYAKDVEKHGKKSRDEEKEQRTSVWTENY